LQDQGEQALRGNGAHCGTAIPKAQRPPSRARLAASEQLDARG
jgi:hypothetical protein